MSFLLTLGGSLGLCLSMRKHARQVFGNSPPSKHVLLGLRITGWALLGLAILISVLTEGIGLGLTLFVAYLNVAVFGIALGLAWRNQAAITVKR